jgi:hypothetical protein
MAPMDSKRCISVPITNVEARRGKIKWQGEKQLIDER